MGGEGVRNDAARRSLRRPDATMVTLMDGNPGGEIEPRVAASNRREWGFVERPARIRRVDGDAAEGSVISVRDVDLPARVNSNARGIVEPRVAAGNRRERGFVERSARIRWEDEDVVAVAVAATAIHGVDVPGRVNGKAATKPSPVLLPVIVAIGASLSVPLGFAGNTRMLGKAEPEYVET